MKRIFFVLALVAMAASCSFAAHYQWISTVENINFDVAQDDNGGYGYVPNADQFGNGFNMTVLAEWLVNANPGDELSITYQVLGITDEGLDFSAGLATLNANADYQTGYASDLVFESGSAVVDGNTYTFTTTLTDAMDKIQRMDVYAFYMYSTMSFLSEYDGTVDYNGQPAFHISNPRVFVNGQEVEAHTLIPEPATYAYGVMGLVSVFGLKRRIKK